MDLDRVRELIRLVEQSAIDELEISGDDGSVRIRKHPQGVALPAASPVAAAAAPAAASAGPAADPARDGLREMRSPIVGTFYRSPSPEAPPFVDVGSRVAPGQTLCIIEAMKVMNEIEADFGGVIREILVENGGPVEAEAVIFLIEPD